MVDNGLLQALHLSEGTISSIFLSFSFFLFAERKKKKEKEKEIVLPIAIPIGRVTWVDCRQSLEGILVFLGCSSEQTDYHYHHFFNFFLAPTSIHPKEKPPPQPPPLGPPPQWPHTGCVKMGHVFYLWSLFWICAFLPLLGSCEGKTQKRGNFKTNGANSPLTPPPPKSPPSASTPLLSLPCTSPLVPMMVWW